MKNQSIGLKLGFIKGKILIYRFKKVSNKTHNYDPFVLITVIICIIASRKI
jgi:hypothetical protein